MMDEKMQSIEAISKILRGVPVSERQKIFAEALKKLEQGADNRNVKESEDLAMSDSFNISKRTFPSILRDTEHARDGLIAFLDTSQTKKENKVKEEKSSENTVEESHPKD